MVSFNIHYPVSVALCMDLVVWLGRVQDDARFGSDLDIFVVVNGGLAEIWARLSDTYGRPTTVKPRHAGAAHGRSVKGTLATVTKHTVLCMDVGCPTSLRCLRICAFLGLCL
jgi:hypothetical protein